MKGHIPERFSATGTLSIRAIRIVELQLLTDECRINYNSRGALTHEATRHDHFLFPWFLPNSVQPWP
jgi:hypothetical protein